MIVHQIIHILTLLSASNTTVTRSVWGVIIQGLWISLFEDDGLWVALLSTGPLFRCHFKDVCNLGQRGFKPGLTRHTSVPPFHVWHFISLPDKQ